MNERITIGQLYPNRIPSTRNEKSKTSSPSGVGISSFEQILKNQTVRFSHHAEVRLQQRGIQIQPEQLKQIDTALDRAAAKGAKDSLIILNGLSLIVNVKNKMVVTAMENSNLNDHVFTKIDSAVIIS